ncbi:MAG: ATPase [Gemmatimonadetes bacterium]|nr:ATPase [Gemmatimonadota bacterium]
MDARLTRSGSLFTLTVERHLPHPPSKVWRVLTEGELLGGWFPCDIEGEWVVGAALQFVFRHGEEESLPEEDLRGEVLAVDEPHFLQFRWGNHVLTYEIEAAGDGCRFILSESFADSSWGARNAAGWEMCIDNLELILEGAAVLKFAAEVWTKKFRRYVEKFEPEFGPQDDPTGVHPLLTEDGQSAG